MTTCRPRRLVWPPLKVVLKRPCSCATALNTVEHGLPGPYPLCAQSLMCAGLRRYRPSGLLGLVFIFGFTAVEPHSLYPSFQITPPSTPKSSYLAFT
eukprot:scaffold3097_cov70-Phaeocystis_antarctica.AAC.2